MQGDKKLLNDEKRIFLEKIKELELEIIREENLANKKKLQLEKKKQELEKKNRGENEKHST